MTLDTTKCRLARNWAAAPVVLTKILRLELSGSEFNVS